MIFTFLLLIKWFILVFIKVIKYLLHKVSHSIHIVRVHCYYTPGLPCNGVYYSVILKNYWIVSISPNIAWTLDHILLDSSMLCEQESMQPSAWNGPLHHPNFTLFPSVRCSPNYVRVPRSRKQLWFGMSNKHLVQNGPLHKRAPNSTVTLLPLLSPACSGCAQNTTGRLQENVTLRNSHN